MSSLLHFGRHLARHWLAYLLLALAAGLLAADLSHLFGATVQARSAGSGVALTLVPTLIACVALWAAGTRLDSTRRELEHLHGVLDRAQTLGRTGTWEHESGGFDWSPRALAILGLEAQSVRGFDDLLGHVAVEDRGQLERAWRAALAGARHRTEVCLTDGRGEVRRVLFEGRLESGQEGDAPRLAGIVQDMSEPYRMQGELRRAMRYQRALLDNFPFMVWLKDRDLRLLAVNRPLAEAGGLEHPDDARGLDDDDLWPTEQAIAYRAEDMEVLQSRAPKYSESVIDSGDRRQWFEAWTAPVLDEDGGLLGTVGYTRDISERKRVEAALARSRDQFAMLGRLQARFIAGEPPDAVFAGMLDILCELSGCDDGFLGEIARDSHGTAHIGLLACRETDWLSERADLIEGVLGTGSHGCASGSIVAAGADSAAGRGLLCIAVTRGEQLTGLIGLAAKDGRIEDERLASVQVAASTFGLILEAGLRERARHHAEAELMRHRDRLTELVEMQLTDSTAVQRAADLANSAKSAFLAGVSHELRTPIHAILGFTRIALRGRPPLCDVTRHRFEVIRENGERLLAQVDELLDLSRLGNGTLRLQRSLCAVQELLDEALRASAGARQISVTPQAGGADATIDADPVRLQQALRTLLDHAIRRSLADSPVDVQLSASSHDGRGGVTVSVCSKGPHLTEQELDSLFDPFGPAAIQRPPGGGTGAGLAICREIVNLHDGRIEARTLDASDAAEALLQIDVWLPAASSGLVTGVSADPAASAPPDRPTTPPPRTATDH
ncbi:PAS domain-containing sensor histidine kinase [Methyloversatilis discipulorum]|uniref:PAS domain-containing sensor histidine kinase n=1 Tax=Methyloversatilis discipulorum TaxID=1119528 RepID=UPI001A389661|nr:PAS domain-containing sensor histidine kinase [Methyloversatilis discipulorum]MBL8469709.1 PAS domain-containing sensor histidine kinase [Methyloversatilis discipulorum]